MGFLFGLVVAIPIIGAVVLFVRRMLRRHRPTPEEIRRAQLSESPGAHLPTGTTEMTQPVRRDPDFEMDANQVRNRQGF